MRGIRCAHGGPGHCSADHHGISEHVIANDHDPAERRPDHYHSVDHDARDDDRSSAEQHHGGGSAHQCDADRSACRAQWNSLEA